MVPHVLHGHDAIGRIHSRHCEVMWHLFHENVVGRLFSSHGVVAVGLLTFASKLLQEQIGHLEFASNSLPLDCRCSLLDLLQSPSSSSYHLLAAEYQVRPRCRGEGLRSSCLECAPLSINAFLGSGLLHDCPAPRRPNSSFEPYSIQLIIEMYQAWKRKSCAKGCRIKH